MAIVFTQEDLDNLKEALVTGIMEVTVQGRTVKYRSQSDIISLIDMIEKTLSSQSSSTDSDFVIGGFNKKGCIDEE